MTTKGGRVELISTSDPWTKLPRGERGTVGMVDSLGTIHVRWDSGSRLGLIPGQDRWTDVPLRACEIDGGPSGQWWEVDELDSGKFVASVATREEAAAIGAVEFKTVAEYYAEVEAEEADR